MKLSVITVNLNNKSGLQKTIESVVSQTHRDIDWIIIDGGSTDGSRELIEEYADYLSYWVSEPDHGIYNAMNKGIRASCGEYLLFLNSGDYLYDKDVLHNVIPLLLDKDFYVGDIEGGGCISSPKLDSASDICAILTYTSLPHQSTFTSRRVFGRYGIFRENILIASDWWISFQALILGNASVRKLPLTVAVRDMTGISTVRSDLLAEEREKLLSELPRIQYISNFYRDNLEIVTALKSSRLIFFIFRIYFYFYRKYKMQNEESR